MYFHLRYQYINDVHISLPEIPLRSYEEFYKKFSSYKKTYKKE